MKKGKSVKLKLFTPIKSSYGTVDSKNLKSLYINIQSSFFNLEVNLYVKSQLDFKSKDVKESVKNIVKTIFKENISNNKYFSFSLTKKPEVNKVD